MTVFKMMSTGLKYWREVIVYALPPGKARNMELVRNNMVRRVSIRLLNLGFLLIAFTTMNKFVLMMSRLRSDSCLRNHHLSDMRVVM